MLLPRTSFKCFQNYFKNTGKVASKPPKNELEKLEAAKAA